MDLNPIKTKRDYQAALKRAEESLVSPALRTADRLTRPYFVGPDLEARQGVGAERAADCNVGSVAASCYEHPADARRVVSSVERMPMAIEKDLEPGGEVHRAMRRRPADVAQVTGAV